MVRLAGAVTGSLRAGATIRRSQSLKNTHDLSIFACMKTTLNIDDELIGRAKRLTGIEEKPALVRLGLKSLIERESAKRLAKLGGSEPGSIQKML